MRGVYGAIGSWFDAVERDLGPVAVLKNFAGIMLMPKAGRPALHHPCDARRL
jgi:hypothetical protein